MANDTYVKINPNNPIVLGSAIGAPGGHGSGVYEGRGYTETDVDLFSELDNRLSSSGNLVGAMQVGPWNITISQLSSATTLSDTLPGNSTTSIVGAQLLAYDGQFTERVRVPASGVDLNTLAVSAITTAWQPASNKKGRLIGGSISVSAAGSVLFEDNAAGSGTMYRTPKLAADTPYNFVIRGGQGYMMKTNGDALKITLSPSGYITGTLDVCEE